jgi:hypothetical protein
MNYRNCHCQIHFPGQIRQAHRIRLRQANIDAVAEAGLFQAPFQAVQHFGLYVHGYDPAGPTWRAKGSVKKPMPGPGSSTIMPWRTYGARISSGFSIRLRNGLANSQPIHQGHTLCLGFVTTAPSLFECVGERLSGS